MSSVPGHHKKVIVAIKQVIWIFWLPSKVMFIHWHRIPWLFYCSLNNCSIFTMFSKKIITSLLLILCIIFAEIAWEKFCSGSIQLFSFLTEDNRELPKKQFSSVQFSHSVVSDCLWPNELQHTRLPCPSSAPRACSNSHPSSRGCPPTISSSV